MKKLLILLCIFNLPQLYADGSMRIEVEVYNGPLSKSLEVQKAELIGTVNLTAHVLANITRAIHLSECRLGCFGSKIDIDKNKRPEYFQRCIKDDPQNNFPYLSGVDITKQESELSSEFIFPQAFKELFRKIFPIKNYRTLDPHWHDINSANETFHFIRRTESIPTKSEDPIHQICPQLADVKLNILSVLGYIFEKPLNGIADGSILNCRETLLADQPTNDGKLGGSEECLTKIANVGRLLTEGAEHWATTQVAILPNSKRTRIEIARAAVTAAELGQELVARSDAIIRQQKGEAMTDLLPTSMFLRDSEGTDYLNMFEWLDATPRVDKQWPTQSRTRMLERLINDSNWSKVNTAFAQGNGKTSMVFVKDDIGNWNLKNYDNDPSEMLDAYKTIGTNLLTSAASLATNMTTPKKVIANIAGVQQNTQQAQNMLFGSAASSSADGMIVNMETQVRERITSTYTQFNNKIVSTAQAITALQKTRTEKEQALQNSMAKYQEIETGLATRQDGVAEKKFLLKQKQAEFDAIKNQIDPNGPPNQDLLKKYLAANNNLIEQKSLYEQALSELERFKVEHQQVISERSSLVADIEKIKASIESLQQLHAQLPDQAVLVIEEILNNYQTTISSVQKTMVSDPLKN